VLIVLWNCEAFLAQCLERLAGDDVDFEILCYDNASVDESVNVARSFGCTVIESDSNVGFPRAVNALAAKASAPHLLLLNPDVAVERGAVRQCLVTLDADDSIGVVGANLRRPDGRFDPPAARRFRTLESITLESFGLTTLLRPLDIQHFPCWDRSDSRDVPCVNGAFMLLRREDFETLGGMDESAFLYLEDQLLCLRMLEQGRRVWFQADARATHVGGGPTETSRDDQRAVAYLHRMDASLEIVRIRQGRWARTVALIPLTMRCVVLLGVSAVRRRRGAIIKYRTALGWLSHQWRRRIPPPPVPS
jgi:GT2 family glycosyltransferase